MTKRKNGQGCIFKRRNGKWCTVITIEIDAVGKQKRKYIYSDTEQEAKIKLKEMVRIYKARKRPHDILLSKWLSYWISNYEGDDISKSTLGNYSLYIERHICPDLGNIYLQDLSAKKIQEFYDNKLNNGRLNGSGGINPKTLRNIHSMLHKSLNQAVQLNLIKTNPCDYINLPKAQQKEIYILNLQERKLLINSAKTERLGIGILLDLNTGLRLGELLALKWTNINFNTKLLTVSHSLNRQRTFDPGSTSKTKLILHEPKTCNSKRIIPLNDVVIKNLELYKQQQLERYGKYVDITTDFVLSDCFNKPIDPRKFHNFFKRILKKAGIRNINFHCLRHTFASLALESGASDKTVSELLGHSNVITTLNIYAHISLKMKKQATDSLYHC